MKKPINLRLPVLYACALTLGIVYSVLLAYFGLNGTFIFIPAVAAFLACALAAVIKRTVRAPLIFVAAIVFFLVGALYAFGKYFSFSQNEVPIGVSAEISGRVEETGITGGGSVYAILNGVTFGGERISGKLIVYLGEAAGDYFGRGYQVTFYSGLQKQDFIEYGEIAYNATRGVKYVCYVNGGLRARYSFSLFGEISNALQRALYNNLDGETAGVCLAMLTGNTDGISSGTLTSFRNGGIAHVFAVSGLHIGVIYGALTFLFRKCRVNRYASTAVKIAVIALYTGVCAFSPSSVRALITCSVAAVASCVFRKYDPLNAIAVAAIVILIINPFSLFLTGFALSFGCMLGIILIRPNFQKLLSFLPKKFSGAVAVGWSAQFASLPVQLTDFGYISAAGLVLNLVFIPVISVLYVALFVCALVCAAIPSAGVILSAACAPLQLLMNVIVACGFDGAIISGSFTRWVYLPFFAITAAVTDKLNLSGFMRGTLTVTALFALILSAVLSTGKSRPSATFTSGYGGASVLLNTDGGTVLVVTGDYSHRGNAGLSVDAVVALDDEGVFGVLNTLDLDCKSVFVRGGAFLPGFGGVTVTRADRFEACGISFAFGENSLTAEVNGLTFTVIIDEAGDGYEGGLSGTEIALYRSQSGEAVLYCGNDGYALAKCGEIRYDIKGWGFLLSSAIPKEQ